MHPEKLYDNIIQAQEKLILCADKIEIEEILVVASDHLKQSKRIEILLFESITVQSFTICCAEKNYNGCLKESQTRFY